MPDLFLALFGGEIGFGRRDITEQSQFPSYLSRFNDLQRGSRHTGSDLRIADRGKERGVDVAGKAAEADTAQWVNDIFHRRERSGEDPVSNGGGVRLAARSGRAAPARASRASNGGVECRGLPVDLYAPLGRLGDPALTGGAGPEPTDGCTFLTTSGRP